MVSELDITKIKPGERYGTTETARLLGVDPSTMYRYCKGLHYYRNADGRRFYTGYDIINWWNTVYDHTGRAVILEDGRLVRRLK